MSVTDGGVGADEIGVKMTVYAIQDLTGCRDPYGDGLAYARYLFRRVVRSPAPGGITGAGDASTWLPSHERRAVRLYGVVLVAGTAACLTFTAAVTLSVDVALLVRAARGLVPERGLASTSERKHGGHRRAVPFEVVGHEGMAPDRRG